MNKKKNSDLNFRNRNFTSQMQTKTERKLKSSGDHYASEWPPEATAPSLKV